MDNRPVSILDLFNKLKDRPSLKDIIFFKDDKLSIVFGEHYKIDIVLIKVKGFLSYINDKYDYDIDDQDIVDLVIELAEKNYYIVERKNITVPKRGSIIFPNRKRFIFLTEKEFDKQEKKWMKKNGIKIFTREKIIYDS